MHNWQPHSTHDVRTPCVHKAYAVSYNTLSENIITVAARAHAKQGYLPLLLLCRRAPGTCFHLGRSGMHLWCP
jgi:hypothetical protein